MYTIKLYICKVELTLSVQFCTNVRTYVTTFDNCAECLHHPKQFPLPPPIQTLAHSTHAHSGTLTSVAERWLVLKSRVCSLDLPHQPSCVWLASLALTCWQCWEMVMVKCISSYGQAAPFSQGNCLAVHFQATYKHLFTFLRSLWVPLWSDSTILHSHQQHLSCGGSMPWWSLC